MTDWPVHERAGSEGRWRAGVDPRELLAAVYDAHAGKLYRYALMLLADHGTAEDAIHEAFAKLAGMGKRLGTINSYEGYLRTAVRNECYRIIRRRRRRSEEIDLSSIDSILEPVCQEGFDEEEIIERDRGRNINRAIDNIRNEHEGNRNNNNLNEVLRGLNLNTGGQPGE